MPQTRHFSDHFYRERRHPSGPVSFLNPTRARFLLGPDRPGREPSVPIYHTWRSRDNRKGRHAAILLKKHVEDAKIHVPRATHTLEEAAKGIWRMVVRYPIWDISYDVAIFFTLGRMREPPPPTPPILEAPFS